MADETSPSSNAVELWTYGHHHMDRGISIHPALSSRRILGVIFGYDTDAGQKGAFLSAFRQRVALVPQIDVLYITTPSDVWTPQLQSEIEQELPNSLYLYSLNIIHQVHHYETVVTHVRATDNTLASSSSASIALDAVNLETATNILSLPNLRSLNFLAPDATTNFDYNRENLKEWTRHLLASFDTLRSVVMPLDFLAYTFDVLTPLAKHRRLGTLELTLPTTVSLFPLVTNEDNRDDTSMAVSDAIDSSLPRLENVTIPMEITSPYVLRSLGRLSDLKILKVVPIGDMGGATLLNVALMNGITSSESFRALRRLDIDAPRTTNLDLTRLARRFRGVEIV